MDNIACKIIAIRADVDALKLRAVEHHRDLNGNGKPGITTRCYMNSAMPRDYPRKLAAIIIIDVRRS